MSEESPAAAAAAGVDRDLYEVTAVFSNHLMRRRVRELPARNARNDCLVVLDNSSIKFAFLLSLYLFIAYSA